MTVLEQERDDLKQKLLDIEGTKDTIQERSLQFICAHEGPTHLAEGPSCTVGPTEHLL